MYADQYRSRINKSRTVFLFTALCLFGRAAHAQQGQTVLNSFADLQHSFTSPPKEFGSAPLWVWNKDIDSASITSMLQQYKNNAFGGVFVHPRAGLITPYLSRQWLSLYRFAVDEAKRIGLDLWIYDENSYPSGFAGGNVPDVMPESFNQGQMLEMHKVTTLPQDRRDFLLCLKKENGQFEEIDRSDSSEKNKTGDYYLFKKTFYYSSPWYGGFSYTDLMVKGVTEKFISETMTGYEKAFGNEFGKTVKGIFSDEPNIEVQYPGTTRWTPDLFDAFYKKWNYHLETCLPALFEETGDWKKIRHNYYQVLLQLFIDRWSKPYAAYAAEKGLEWTGHYWEHEWPNVNHGPDNMAMYAWPQRPGIDMLFNRFDERSMNAQFGNIRSVKELAGVANQLDKKRTLSETYGGGGWELTFKDMKRLGDWEFALGINTLNQHLSFMSIRGARKYDYPQSFSYHTPWWPYYKYLNAYFGRLSLALSQGKQVNHILVIEPTTTVWMYFKNDIDSLPAKVSNIGNQFQQFITRLEKNQVEYDLGSENIIHDHGKITDRKFGVGSCDYTTVVLPPGMENIDSMTFVLLKKYAEAGGNILQYAALKTIDGSANKALEAFYAAKYPGLIVKDSLGEKDIRDLAASPELIITADKNRSGDLYHYRRKMQDGDLIFLSNADIVNPAGADLSTSKKNVLLMDLFSGKIMQYPVTRNSKNTSLHIVLQPAGSRLLFLTDKNYPNLKAFVPDHETGKMLHSQTVVSRSSGNVLTIDFCDLAFANTRLTDQHVFDAADTVFKYYGFREGNPWNTSVQFKDHTIRRDTFSTSTGFTATYYFSVGEGVDARAMTAVVESPNLYKVLLNGHEVSAVPGRWWLDKSFGVFDISKYVVPGKNEIRVSASPMSVYAEIEPVYIVGNFGLESLAKGWQLVKAKPLALGSWKNQEIPMYGGEVVYRKEITVEKKPANTYIVRLNNWKGTVAAVKVNHLLAGVIGWSPYNCDISKYVKTGKNIIEVCVIGSLKNTLGPHHNKPEPGLVSPWQWRYIKKYPAGKDYDLYDYGLMDDFSVIVN